MRKSQNNGGLRWLGYASLHGIPARDLSAEEVEKFGRDYLLETGLYDEIQPESEVNYGRSEEAPQDPIGP
ncbi:MAG: hypothetical protein KJ556_20955 [Gammaproteobacteria bacterium]|nr:hypothetical protein [Gammaproteobacteria bacterium]